MCNPAHCELVFVSLNILLLTSHLFISVEGFSFMYHGSPCKAAVLFLWFDACKNTIHDIQLISELWFLSTLKWRKLSFQFKRGNLNFDLLTGRFYSTNPEFLCISSILQSQLCCFIFLFIQSVSKCLSKHIKGGLLSVCLHPGPSPQWGYTINVDHNYNKYALTSLSRLSIKDVISWTSPKRFNRNNWRSLCRWLSRPS